MCSGGVWCGDVCCLWVSDYDVGGFWWGCMVLIYEWVGIWVFWDMVVILLFVMKVGFWWLILLEVVDWFGGFRRVGWVLWFECCGCDFDDIFYFYWVWIVWCG